MMDNCHALPNGWVVAPLEALLVPLEDGRTLHHGWSPQCEKEPSGNDNEWGVLKTTAIQPGAFLAEHNKKLPTSLSPRPQHEVKAGDLLITCAGPRVRCGIPCLVKSTRPRLMLSGKMYRFRVSDAYFDARYLEKYLLSAKAQFAIDAMKTGGSESGLNLTHDRFKPLPVPVAPLNEQKRIASKIDELFSRIDEAERALERSEKLVERYRQSVLRDAVTGKLTQLWREKNRGKFESGGALLARILRARREAWEVAELGRMKTKGITPSNENWKKKYVEPPPPDTAGLPDLPEGWAWASFPQLGEFGRGKSKHRPRNDPKLYGGSYPFLQTGAIRASKGRITSYDTTYNDFGLAQSKLWPRGTICITIAANIAASGILEMEACFPDSVVGLVPDANVVGEYIEFFVRTERASLDRYAPATAQKNINIEILERVAIPFPPLDEQRAIYAKAQEELSKIDDVERTLATGAAESAALRQSVLKAAFSGSLVHQDPSDESAVKLLQRIAAERSQKLSATDSKIMAETFA